MATNDEIPASDTEMADCDGEKVVTMMDVLKEQQDIEDDANAVLGGSDEKECTYSKGYIKRQAIYACLSCCPEAKEDPSMRAGFCLACSLNCHENHDLIELYTKRKFKCDCGNPKFKTPCQFTPKKLDLNVENIYNQNFIGLYCICSKPYGDQESTLDDEMIQCIVCEDWWHASHLDAVVPANDQYSEMVCKLCMAKNEFLYDYGDLAINIESNDVDVIKANGIDVSVNDEKLTNGVMCEEKLVNGVCTEKLTNNIEDSSVDMEISSQTLNDTQVSHSESDINSAETESIEPEQVKLLEETIKSEKPVENLVHSFMKTDEPTEALQSFPDDGGYKAETITEYKSKDNKLPDSETGDTIEKSDVSFDIKPEVHANDSEPHDITSEVNIPTENNSEECNIIDKKIPDTDATLENIAPSESNSEEVNKEITDEISASSEQKLNDGDKDKPGDEHASAMEEIQPTESEHVDCTSQDKSNALNREVIDTSTESSVKDNKDNTDQLANTEIAIAENEISTKEASNGIITDNNETKCDDTSKIDKEDLNELDNTNKIESEINDNVVPDTINIESKRKISTGDTLDNLAKKPKVDINNCVRPRGIKKVINGATFWSGTFRQKLCTCDECMSMYKDLSVLFLTDPEDTVFAYETLGKERTAGKPNQYEKGIEALCSLGRIQQIDALTEYNKMRDKLLAFLQSFKERKEVVTENDIKTFFAGMKPEKRTDGVYFCG